MAAQSRSSVHGLRLRQGRGEDARSTLHHHPRQRRGLKPLLLLMMCPISSYPSPSCPAKFLPSPSRCVLHREGLALVYIVHPIAVLAFTRVVLLVCDKPYRRRRRSNHMFFVTSRRPTCPTSPKLPATVWPWIFAALAAPKIGGSLPHIHMVERTMWTTAKSATVCCGH